MILLCGQPAAGSRSSVRTRRVLADCCAISAATNNLQMLPRRCGLSTVASSRLAVLLSRKDEFDFCMVVDKLEKQKGRLRPFCSQARYHSILE